MPKNHIASNTVKIKQLMRKVKEREAQKEREHQEKNVPVKALWKSEKYNNVQSKLKEMLLLVIFLITPFLKEKVLTFNKIIKANTSCTKGYFERQFPPSTFKNRTRKPASISSTSS